MYKKLKNQVRGERCSEHRKMVALTGDLSPCVTYQLQGGSGVYQDWHWQNHPRLLAHTLKGAFLSHSRQQLQPFLHRADGGSTLMSSGVTDQTGAKSVEAWEPVYIWCRPLCPQQLECGFLCTRSSSHVTPPRGRTLAYFRSVLGWGEQEGS